MKIKEQLISAIEDADKVLIGIGSEFDVDFEQWNEKHYCNRMLLPEWTLGYQQLLAMREGAGQMQNFAYQKIRDLLQGKDYYIISLGMDDVIYETFSKDEPVVTPCGGLHFMQCQEGCSSELLPVDDSVLSVLKMLKSDEVDLEGLENITPKCKHCNMPLVFNNLYANQYIEDGYLEQWAQYMKWLQGTVNRKLCIIELGVGMKFPSIIRFAFDKLAYYNQKSTFFRIHENLYQHTSENAKRGISIRENALEFILQET